MIFCVNKSTNSPDTYLRDINKKAFTKIPKLFLGIKNEAGPIVWSFIPNPTRLFILGIPEAAVAPFVEAAKVTRSLGMGLNAGHDLSLVNLKYMHDNIPWLDEVSIGHALISDALYLGLKQTIEEYKNCLR